MPNLFEHFTTSVAYVHIIFINIVQANEMPNLFEHFTMSEAYIHINFINIVQASEMQYKGHSLSPMKRLYCLFAPNMTRINYNYTPLCTKRG